MNTNRLPNEKLHSLLAQEEVVILSNKEVSLLTEDKLEIAKDYYTSVLESLVGQQVWDIIDCIKAVDIETFNRRKNTFKKVI